MAQFSFVNNDNDVIRTDDQKQANEYRDMGYRRAGDEDFKLDQIKQQYSGAWNTVKAAGVGLLSSVPFAKPAVTAAISPFALGGQAAVQDQMQGLEVAHPTASKLGGFVGDTAALVSGEGLLADGLIEGAGVVAAASRGAVANAALGLTHKTNSDVLQHAISPGGDEHVWADIGQDLLMDAAIGGAGSLAGAGLAKGIGSAAKTLGSLSEDLSGKGAREAILDYGKVNTAFDAARKDDLAQFFTSKGYDALNFDEVSAAIKKRMPDLELQYNEIKTAAKIPLPSSQVGVLADNLGDILEGTDHARAVLGQLVGEEGGLTVEKLHNLRQFIDNRINYKNFDPTDTDRALYNARNTVSEAIRNTLRTNDMVTNGVRAEVWQQIDKEYSNSKIIQEIMSAKPTFLDSAIKAGKAYQSNMRSGLGLLTWLAGWKGLAAHSVLSKAINTAQKLQSGEYATAAQTLRRVFDRQAETWSKAVQAGLYGAPEAATALVNRQVRAEDYENLSAKTDWIKNNPQAAVGNLGGHLNNAGVDSDTNQKLTQRATVIAAYLSAQKPPNPQANSIMPTHAFVPQELKLEWVGQYTTAHDPTHALADPTPKNLAVLKQFYPEFYQNTVNAVIEQCQNNPNMPLESRLWASRICGMPVDNLTNPATWELIQMGRQAQEQKEQQAQQQAEESQKRSKGGKSGSGAVDSNSTELQRLQGK